MHKFRKYSDIYCLIDNLLDKRCLKITKNGLREMNNHLIRQEGREFQKHTHTHTKKLHCTTIYRIQN